MTATFPEMDYTLYALIQPDEIITWSADGISPRGQKNITWVSGPTIRHNGSAITAFAHDGSDSDRMYVSSGNLKRVTMYEQRKQLLKRGRDAKPVVVMDL